MARVVGFETLSVTATAVGCTAATLQGGNLAVGEINTITPPKKKAANYALFGPLETAQIRWRDDGTAPTAAVGHLMETGQTLEYDGDLNNIQFIRTGGTSGSLPVTYYARNKAVL